MSESVNFTDWGISDITDMPNQLGTRWTYAANIRAEFVQMCAAVIDDTQRAKELTLDTSVE
jgi:hypothetical protein